MDYFNLRDPTKSKTQSIQKYGKRISELLERSHDTSRDEVVPSKCDVIRRTELFLQDPGDVGCMPTQYDLNAVSVAKT